MIREAWQVKAVKMPNRRYSIAAGFIDTGAIAAEGRIWKGRR